MASFTDSLYKFRADHSRVCGPMGVQYLPDRWLREGGGTQQFNVKLLSDGEKRAASGEDRYSVRAAISRNVQFPSPARMITTPGDLAL
ncbi:hypothetical protein EYF80_002751 [Liparis tanakae]|uniref:Uncharacterized protein n=1 Tax=Liparis tanakae TaxID=230148 RepID=A0A4Z2J9U4_9TELE|nr:hypothetical protein EYF80_002751 [Liparis tanakae]